MERDIFQIFKQSIYVPFVARHDVTLKEVEKVREEVNKKYSDSQKLAEFITTRFMHGEDTSQWHLSPFGLIWDKGNYFKNYFKGNNGTYSLRHIVEQMIQYKEPQEVKEDLKKLIEIFYEGDKIEPFINKRIDKNKVLTITEGDRFYIDNQEVYVQENPSKTGFYIIWDKVSRVATHQLVRHQSFDYQQQSQRYINLSKQNKYSFYIPPSVLKESNLSEYIHDMVKGYKKYEELIKRGYKPEDARFYLPQSASSRIVIYAPKDRQNGRDGIKEFINKRKVHGQEEIKNFALTLDKILNEYF